MSNKFLRPLLLVAIIILSIYVGVKIGNQSTNRIIRSMSGDTKSDKLSLILKTIAGQYVDPVNVDSITEAIIPDILEHLDPHSVYIPAKDYSASNESLEGNFDGIGVSFSMLTDTVIVGNVIKKGPSFRANVYPGDRIIKVNDSVIAGRGIKQDSIMRLLRGVSGSMVKIGVQRVGEKKLIDIKITRGKIPVPSVDVAYLISPKIAYIRVTQFGRTTHDEFTTALERVTKEGAQQLIVDLRDNGGGYLDQAFEMANEFIPKDKLIVYTEGHSSPRQNLTAKGNGSYLTNDLVILIDETSASASEILAGAVQDNDRGTIIGRRSFGKGLVQEPIEFSDGSGMRLTIARYYTPAGRCIQRPYTNGTGDYYDDIMRRYEHGEMLSGDSIHLTDTTKYFTTKGRVVYGGGGITPDVFVPIDTSGVTDYFRKIRQHNVLFYYALSYSDRHRAALNSITSTDELDAFYALNPPMQGFDAFASAKGVTAKNEQERLKSRSLIETHVKSLIGQGTPLDDVGAMYYVNKTDWAVQKALTVISQPKQK